MANNTSFIIIFLVILLLWLPQAVYQIITWTYWLQIKEYRFDRFWVFLKSAEGRESLGILKIVLKIVAVLMAVFSLWILVFLLIFLDLVIIKDYFGKRIRKPKITQRIKKIWLTSLIGIILTLFLFQSFLINALVIGEIFLVMTPFLGIIWTIQFVDSAKKKEVLKAEKILKDLNPTVIGITGSYGKTTTKEFIYQLLSQKYKCLSTYKNQNTHFGILRRINNDLKKDHKFFIAEMGAYKKGEIKEIAEILKPKAAFITGIEPQHLELFGSFEDLKSAKFELIESLQEGGVAFINLSDSGVYEFVNKTNKLKKDIKLYTYALDKKNKLDAKTEIIDINSKGIVFRIFMEDGARKIRTNIISKNLVENLTGAILASRTLGVEWKKITRACKNLSLPEGTLNVYKTKRGVIVIDDSYNSSPSGFGAALEVIDLFKGRRRFIATTGIIELGRETEKVHKKLAEIMDKKADCILLRNRDFERSIRSGLKNKNKLILITDPKKMLNYLKNNLKRGDVLLIEGKLPQIVDYFRCDDTKRKSFIQTP